MAERVLAQFGVGIGPDQGAARIVEIHAPMAAGGIVERVTERREIGNAALKPVKRRRVSVERQGSVDPVVPVEHAAKILFLDPTNRP